HPFHFALHHRDVHSAITRWIRPDFGCSLCCFGSWRSHASKDLLLGETDHFILGVIRNLFALGSAASNQQTAAKQPAPQKPAHGAPLDEQPTVRACNSRTCPCGPRRCAIRCRVAVRTPAAGNAYERLLYWTIVRHEHPKLLEPLRIPSAV